MSGQARQPWIHSGVVDGAFILAPALLAVLATAWWQATGRGSAEVSLAAWAVLVVGVDVAHVYATLYRTYFDRRERRSLSAWLWWTPLLAWLAGSILYSTSAALFWSVLAYAAVFHFIRQQYGFMMIYARADRAIPAWARRLDQVAIYAATLVPMLYWHTHLPLDFNWFVDDEFVALPAWLWDFTLPCYVALGVACLAKEAWLLQRGFAFNLPRNALLAVTALSWYVGIVVDHGDLAFTLTNVVAHGVPYIALTCIYKNHEEKQRQTARQWFSGAWLAAPVGLLVLFAYAEEWLWDGMVWREHASLFPGDLHLPQLQSATWLAIVVPLLATPQLTHYLLDAVIWRMRAQPEWRATLFWRPGTAP